MENFEEKLREYAKLCIKVGINVQASQPLVINASIESIDFVRLVAEEAYRAGASEVHVNWSDEVLTKLKYRNSPMEVFESFPQ